MTEELKVFVALDERQEMWIVGLEMGHKCVDAVAAGGFWFGVERDTFETGRAVVAGEAFGVESSFLSPCC